MDYVRRYKDYIKRQKTKNIIPDINDDLNKYVQNDTEWWNKTIKALLKQEYSDNNVLMDVLDMIIINSVYRKKLSFLKSIYFNKPQLAITFNDPLYEEYEMLGDSKFKYFPKNLLSNIINLTYVFDDNIAVINVSIVKYIPIKELTLQKALDNKYSNFNILKNKRTFKDILDVYNDAFLKFKEMYSI